MYITQDIADRIKDQVKKQGTTMRTLLNECGLNINAVSQFAKGKQLSCVSLAKIADYLDCSVDYLLGRTTDPESHKQKGPVLMVENEPRYLVRRAGRDGILSEEYLTKDEIDKMNEYIDSLEDANF